MSRYDARTRGDVTVSTKVPQLTVKVFRNTADSGIRTMKQRYSSEKPRARLNPGNTL